MADDQSEARVTVWMSEALKDELDARLDYGDSRSENVREAVQFRMAVEDALDRRGMKLPEDADERQAMIEDIAMAGVATFAGEDAGN